VITKYEIPQAGIVAKNNRNKCRKTTTTLIYKHSNLLKTHTYTHKTKRVRKTTKNVHMYKSK